MRAEFKKIRRGVKTTRQRSKIYASGNVIPKSQSTLVSLIKNVAGGLSETKRVIFYNAATPNFPNEPGTLSNTGYTVQNQFIQSNVSDIKRLIPIVTQGVQENQRIANSIKPVALNVRARVVLNVFPGSPVGAIGGTDLIAVLYVLQHKVLKSYTTLAAQNDFQTLLETGENATKPFGGQPWDSQLPVNPNNYQLIKKKKIKLRWGGLDGGPIYPGSTGPSYLANSHQYMGEVSMNLKKHLPVSLKYPEAGGTTPPASLNDPSNSSVFMCIGFYNYPGILSGATPSPLIQMQYTSELLYKDS